MAPTLVNFTLRDNQFATASDSDDGGADSDVVSLIGPVKFIPQINRPALGTTLSPQAMLSLRTIDGYYDTDGQLKNKRGGSVGVRIPANDPVLGLARLPYKAVFGPMTTPPGDVVPLPDVTFDAPATDTTLWLPSVAPLPGATALGITKGDKGDPVDDVQSALSDTAAQFYVKGTPIGDPLVLPSAAWGSILGKPAVIAAGANATAARAAVGAAKQLTYLIDDYGTVDYTGATVSDAAVAAAKTAMGTGPGVLSFGDGVVKLNTMPAFDHPGQGFEGRGNGLTRIDYRGPGDCFRAWDSTQVMDGAHGPHQAGPMTGLTIDLSANTNEDTCGLHIGDLFAIFIDDVVIIPAETAGSKAFWNHNTYSWSERGFIRFNILGSPAALGDQVVLSGDDDHPLGRTSMSYSTYFITVDCENANQRGVVWEKNAAAAGVFFSVTGNFHGGVSSNDGVALTVGTAPDDACFIRGFIQVNGETIGAGTFGYKDIDVSAASLIEGTGCLDFQDYGSSSFVAGSATGDTVRLAGYKHCPSLKASHDDIQDAAGNVLLRMQAQVNALNYLGIGNRAAGNPPKIFTGGADSHIPILLTPKGNAGIQVYKDAGHSTVPMVASGDDADVGWDFQTQGDGTVTINGVEIPAIVAAYIADLAMTLTDKTLDSPKINAILDSNGNPLISFTANASAVNRLGFANRAAGNPPYLYTLGTDAEIPIVFQPKGDAGWFTYISNMAKTDFEWVVVGDPTNLGHNFLTQGTGRLKENGNITATRVGVPASASATGKVGQFASDANFHYDCIATNTWVRSAAATW